ncbi:MAG TPA: ABC transporter permease subunit [Anaerolineales bacterium]|nr:ABC transporter permease subunit [Anaerolineales bacterium]
MGTSQHVFTPTAGPAMPSRSRLLFSAIRYLAGKALTILITIFVGVFVTMLIINYPSSRGGGLRTSPFEVRLETQIYNAVQAGMYDGTFPIVPNGLSFEEQEQAWIEKLRSEVGLNLPFVPRNLLWTFKALWFNWGRLNPTYVDQVGLGQRPNAPSDNIVLQFLPNTLLLIGSAYLLVFLIGIPLALHLARNQGNLLDRFLTLLSPVSSVPSWIFAVLLIAVFAVQLRWLPVGGMFDFHRPENAVEYTWTLLRHMLLPVTALVLSILFQLVYTWRTFFILYSEEDYVELARAKGLKNHILERQHILRPALPYIITSFATSLIAFWQLTMALEAVFQWPGVGLLYIKTLPNYWGEAMEVGDLMIVIQLVVIFAYLLGLLVFLLDIFYVIVDPRIHLLGPGDVAQTNARIKRRKTARKFLPTAWIKRKGPGRAPQATGPGLKPPFSLSEFLRDARETIIQVQRRSSLLLQELRAYPSAIFGLVMIIFLLAGSLYAVLALPYEEFGREYGEERVTAQNYVPRLAAPIWFNYLSRKPRLSTLVMDETSRHASVSTRALDNGWFEKTITFKFDYEYGEIPSDVVLFFHPKYDEKFPFASMVWTTPDGRIIDLKAKAVSGDTDYDFKSGLAIAKLLNQNSDWKNWFVVGGQYPTPPFKLLFAKPGSVEAVPQRGIYQLEITSILFEEDSDLQPKLALLGQVYGAAGTDIWRRDLIVPLFWGMPFTLIVGFMGTLMTTVIAMLLPAVGVWFGGWMDALIQRLTEVNMVLPGLAIAVLANAIFGTHIWILLGVVVLLNAFGGPIKTFRSAFLQAKEAPYIEVARSYGASNFRIISHYLIPRILPVFIPHLVTQIPSFIFLEATLGFFNIRSNYPSWGRIIYEGLSQGALYGSPFWVLQPIFLLLLTGLAFAMLGAALERILNPRVIDNIPLPKQNRDEKRTATRGKRIHISRRMLTGLAVLLLIAAIIVPLKEGKTLTSNIMQFLDPIWKSNLTIRPTSVKTDSPPLVTGSPQTDTPDPGSEILPTPLLPPQIDATQPLIPAELPDTYILQKGEYPYCIARRFNVDANELLSLNGLANGQAFFAGTILDIPQTGNPFQGNRTLRPRPTTYVVSAAGETIYTIACAFGDLDPLLIAQTNNISTDALLLVGRQLEIP